MTLILIIFTYLQWQIKLAPIMETIKMMESSGGTNCATRYEPRFLKEYGKSGNMPALRKKYGDRAAASSYGCFQVMLSTANELFRTTDLSPEMLSHPIINEFVATTFVRKWYIRYKGNVEKIFYRYNGGEEYVRRATSIYEEKIKGLK